MSELFDKWATWKEAQTEPTCDHIGCRQLAYWMLPRNTVYFCVKHGAEMGGTVGMKNKYGESPEVLE